MMGMVGVAVKYASIVCRLGRSTALARRKVLGDIGDAALKRHLATRRLAGNEIGFGADNVQNNVTWEVVAKLSEPKTHVYKGLGVIDGVAENAGVGAAVVEPSY